MNHDMVFWGVIVCVAGGFLTLAWLFFMLWRNMNKPSGSK